MQQEHRWRSRPLCAGKEFGVSNVVGCKRCVDRAAPRDLRTTIAKYSGKACPEVTRRMTAVRHSIILLRRELLAPHQITLHLFAAVPVQPVPGVKQIQRCAEQRIDSFCARTSQRMTASFHPLLWWMRQIICRELECLAQFRVQAFECVSQFGFDSFARPEFL